MVTSDERLAHLEGRVGEHSQMFMGLRETIAQFEQRLDRRFEQIEARFTILESRMTALDQKFSAEIGGLRREMLSQFRWTMGLVFTGFVTVVAAIIAR